MYSSSEAARAGVAGRRRTEAERERKWRRWRGGKVVVEMVEGEGSLGWKGGRAFGVVVGGEKRVGEDIVCVCVSVRERERERGILGNGRGEREWGLVLATRAYQLFMDEKGG